MNVSRIVTGLFLAVVLVLCLWSNQAEAGSASKGRFRFKRNEESRSLGEEEEQHVGREEQPVGREELHRVYKKSCDEGAGQVFNGGK